MSSSDKPDQKTSITRLEEDIERGITEKQLQNRVLRKILDAVESEKKKPKKTNNQKSNTMKNKLLIIIALSLSIVSQAQISGVKTIPGDYATIAAAVSALNTSGVGSGGVTFNVQDSYLEEITAPILLTATGTTDDPIIFQAFAPTRSPLTVNPIVRRTDIGTVTTTALEAQGDAVIIIQGGDFITFDGIDVQATTDAIEYGYFLRKASATDGCKNVTIKNAGITMTKGTSAYVIGIYASNLDALSPANNGAGITVTSTDGRNENLLFTGNTISNTFIGIAIRGYNHTGTPYNLMDQNNVVGSLNAGNTILNFGGNAAGTCAGVHLYYQTSPNVSYNIIDNVGGGGSPATAGLYGIWHQLSSNVGNFVANNNTITFAQGGTAGGTCIQATPAGQSDNSILIQNNTFSFGEFTSTGTVYIINCTGAKANNITVSGNSTVGSIIRTSASGTLRGYYNIAGTNTGGTQTVSNNNFSNIELGGDGIFTGIDCRSGSTNTQTNIITNNTITNITAGGQVKGIIQSYGAAGSSVNNNTISGLINTNGSTGVNNTVNGIMLGSNGASLSLTCYNNTISELRGAGPVYGIWNQQGANNQIYQNKISGLRNNTTSIGPLYGMIINGGTTVTVYNNFISELTAPTSTGDFVIMGVYVAGGTNVYFYNNTIYLNATTSATTFGTAGIYAQTTVNFEMRNNIIVNTSQRAGNTGFTVAYRRFDNNLSSYSNASDNNDLYVASNSPIGNYLYCDGSSTTPVTARDSTLADYQTRMYPRELKTFNELPPFVNVAGIPYDLHLKSDIATLCESGGATISTPGITFDIDNDPRYPNAGYPNNPNPAYYASNPDVGADEFGGIHAYSPLSGVTGVVTNASCLSDSDGAINITESGGIPPFAYIWSNGATVQDLTDLAPGTYTVTVTDDASSYTTGSWSVGSGSVCNNITVSGNIVSAGCFNARHTITVSGLTVTAPNGQVELIAGENILLQPGTVVESGAWFYAHISTTYCPGADAPITAAAPEAEAVTGISTRGFSIYPNPTSGNLTLEIKGNLIPSHVAIEIYSISGNRVMTGEMTGEKSREFMLSTLPAGVYFARIMAEGAVETVRVVRTR